MGTFKLALDAGHGIHTDGRRIPKNLDPEQHREWWLNDRVCRYIEEAAAQYEGFLILRVDDVTGQEDVPMSTRCRRANDFGADLYYSVHHNAGINGGYGGGITAYSYKEGTAGAAWRDTIYDRIIGHTGLKGNRATPTTAANYFVLRETNMPAVLVEHGFMDSPSDVPVILTEQFARSAAQAFVSAVASKVFLKKKPAEAPSETPADVWYRVQVGAFRDKSNAYALLEALREAGFDGYVKTT